MPRLSVPPASINVEPGELTTPPSAMVSVPTGSQPQPASPTASPAKAFKTEPAPVTVNVEEPLSKSPMVVRPVTLTVPPLEIVNIPGPPVLPPPTARPKPPTVQVEPAPVTRTVGVPIKGNASISAPPWLSSMPPLEIVNVPGPKMPKPVKPLVVTVEPGPVMVMLLATRRSAGLRRGADLQRAAVGHGERPAEDRDTHGKTGDAQRSAVDREPAGRAIAQLEIAADRAARAGQASAMLRR